MQHGTIPCITVHIYWKFTLTDSLLSAALQRAAEFMQWPHHTDGRLCKWCNAYYYADDLNFSNVHWIQNLLYIRTCIHEYIHILMYVCVFTSVFWSIQCIPMSLILTTKLQLHIHAFYSLNLFPFSYTFYKSAKG